METNFLKTILCILEEGSFQKAARRLNCSQSTVTFHVRQVERELSVRLFEKSGRKMVLTGDGKVLLPHIHSMLREAEFLQNYGKSEMLLEGVLKVGVPDELYCYGFDKVIDAFHKKIPNVRLIAKPMRCHDIQEGINNNELDIGVHCDIGGYSDNIIEEEVSWFQPVLIASAKTNDTDYISFHQRKNRLLITNDPGGLHIKKLKQYFEQRDIGMEGILELNSTEAVKINVMSGMGISYLPDFVVQEELQSGKFRKLDTGLDGDIIPVVCVCHKNNIEGQAVSIFREIVKEVLDKEGRRK